MTVEGTGRKTAGGQSPTLESPGWTCEAAPAVRGDQFSTFPLCVRGALPKPGELRFLRVQFHSPGRRPRPRLSDHPKFPTGEQKAVPGYRNYAGLFRGAQHPTKRRTNFACTAAPGGCPYSRWDADSRLGVCGAQCAQGHAAGTPRVPWLHRATCAPSGFPTGTSGLGGAAACSFQTRAAPKISSPVWK